MDRDEEGGVMGEKKYELPAWCNGLIIFLFTPAIVLLTVSAFIALVIVVTIILIANLPLFIWCAITRREFEFKYWAPIEKQKKEKNRE